MCWRFSSTCDVLPLLLIWFEAPLSLLHLVHPFRYDLYIMTTHCLSVCFSVKNHAYHLCLSVCHKKWALSNFVSEPRFEVSWDPSVSEWKKWALLKTRCHFRRTDWCSQRPYFKSSKNVSHPMFSLSMAYNVISCKKINQNTQLIKIADFAV